MKAAGPPRKSQLSRDPRWRFDNKTVGGCAVFARLPTVSEPQTLRRFIASPISLHTLGPLGFPAPPCTRLGACARFPPRKWHGFRVYQGELAGLHAPASNPTSRCSSRRKRTSSSTLLFFIQGFTKTHLSESARAGNWLTNQISPLTGSFKIPPFGCNNLIPAALGAAGATPKSAS